MSKPKITFIDNIKYSIDRYIKNPNLDLDTAKENLKELSQHIQKLQEIIGD